jgi:thiol-disulfide isomerase/thioredoxin
MKWMVILVAFVGQMACGQNKKVDKATDTTKIPTEAIPGFSEVNTQEIKKDFMSWYEYHYRNIKLNVAFVGLSIEGKIISRDSFFNSLESGRYIALAKKTKDNIYYKLESSAGTEESVPVTISQLTVSAKNILKLYQKPLPNFNVTTLDGENYTADKLKGNIVALKCWFINCSPCVKEMPELNELVLQHKNNANIKFISLALDEKEELNDFLKTTSFLYKTVGGAENYITQTLNVQAFPTHILINKEGNVVLVTNAIEEFKEAFNELVAKG